MSNQIKVSVGDGFKLGLGFTLGSFLELRDNYEKMFIYH